MYPSEYIRKQSLVNAERFISPELKKYEEEISGAQDKIIDLEQKIFQQIREEVSLYGTRIQKMANIIADIDALTSFAEVAHNNNYSKPNITNESIH